MFRRIAVILVISIISNEMYAGNDNQPAGAAGAGMAHASVTLTDVWSAFNNQAGMAYIDGVSVGLYNEIKYGVKENAYNAFALVIPVKSIGNFSFSASYYGFKLYNEQKLGIAYARQFGKNLSAAIQTSYLATNIQDEYYGNRNMLTMEAGLRAQVTEKMAMGFHLYNPFRSALSDYNDERTPAAMKLGISYKFNQKVLTALEAEKSTGRQSVFKFGVEYHITEPLYIRTGISTNNTTGYFGFGLLIKKVNFDFAASWHQVLGFTPQTSLSIKF